MKNTKGIELALNTVVVIAVLLIVAVVIISFFLGMAGAAFGPIADLLQKAIFGINQSASGLMS